jgi:hypothetical protein
VKLQRSELRGGNHECSGPSERSRRLHLTELALSIFFEGRSPRIFAACGPNFPLFNGELTPVLSMARLTSRKEMKH